MKPLLNRTASVLLGRELTSQVRGLDHVPSPELLSQTWARATRAPPPAHTAHADAAAAHTINARRFRTDCEPGFTRPSFSEFLVRARDAQSRCANYPVGS